MKKRGAGNHPPHVKSQTPSLLSDRFRQLGSLCQHVGHHCAQQIQRLDDPAVVQCVVHSVTIPRSRGATHLRKCVAPSAVLAPPTVVQHDEG